MFLCSVDRQGKEDANKEVVYEILEKVMNELHKAGYFAGARFKTIEIGGEPAV